MAEPPSCGQRSAPAGAGADPKVHHVSARPPQGRAKRATQGAVQAPMGHQPQDLSWDRSPKGVRSAAVEA